MTADRVIFNKIELIKRRSTGEIRNDNTGNEGGATVNRNQLTAALHKKRIE